MAAFLSDTMTEGSNTTLGTHTPETGGSWAQHPNFTTNTLIVGGGLGYCYGSSSAGTSIYYNNATPPNADYYVEATVRTNAAGTVTDLMGVCGRVATGASTMYMLFYNDNIDEWKLEKLVAGASTAIGTYVSALAAATSATIKLEMIGTSIKVYLNGVERISVTDSSISDAGFVGIRGRSNGYILDVTADQIAGGGSSIPAIAAHYSKLRRA